MTDSRLAQLRIWRAQGTAQIVTKSGTILSLSNQPGTDSTVGRASRGMASGKNTWPVEMFENVEVLNFDTNEVAGGTMRIDEVAELVEKFGGFESVAEEQKFGWEEERSVEEQVVDWLAGLDDLNGPDPIGRIGGW